MTKSASSGEPTQGADPVLEGHESGHGGHPLALVVVRFENNLQGVEAKCLSQRVFFRTQPSIAEVFAEECKVGVFCRTCDRYVPQIAKNLFRCVSLPSTGEARVGSVP